MSNITARTKDNVFYNARIAQSTHNEMLTSREGAADIMAIDRGRLYRIENGIVDPYPEEVHLMADLYGAPHLRNFYCTHCCPLGCHVPDIEPADLDRITVKALSVLRNATTIKEDLLTITEDGVIDDDEKPVLDAIIQSLEEVSAITASLKNWVEVNKGRRNP